MTAVTIVYFGTLAGVVLDALRLNRSHGKRGHYWHVALDEGRWCLVLRQTSVAARPGATCSDCGQPARHQPGRPSSLPRCPACASAGVARA